VVGPTDGQMPRAAGGLLLPQLAVPSATRPRRAARGDVGGRAAVLSRTTRGGGVESPCVRRYVADAPGTATFPGRTNETEETNADTAPAMSRRSVGPERRRETTAGRCLSGKEVRQRREWKGNDEARFPGRITTASYVRVAYITTESSDYRRPKR